MKLLGIALSILLFASTSHAQDKKLRAYLDNKQFFAPGIGNYVEFNLQFVGYSLNYTGVEGGLMGNVLVEYTVIQDEDTIVSQAYRLDTPLMRDSIVEDFYDVQRFQLNPGIYMYGLKLTDLNSDGLPLTAEIPILVEDLSDFTSISSLTVAEIATEGNPESLFYKSGYNIIPRLSTFYPEQLNTLPIYFEVYNSSKLDDTSFQLRQSITDATSGENIEAYCIDLNYVVNDVVPVFRKIQIDALKTGKYLLKYSIVKNDIELSSQTYAFERSNDRLNQYANENVMIDPSFQKSITDDSLLYFLECLIPICGPNEVRNIAAIAKTKDSERARKYIQTFWITTAPDNPYEGWLRYKQQVQMVERLYANNFQEGYETDRGRVYLQYGAPTNIINREISDTEYPYEIWRYNKIGVFSNKRFIFYNPELVNNTYRLLHSDMIGELKNSSWPLELSKRNTKNGGIDTPNANVMDKWGQNSINDFNR
ncbi:GWxTD domain-containing protein [Crocinitomicaceae bacterium]|nr:GWxTD domain-containing protein [Crocinitomicaceae bacterium]